MAPVAAGVLVQIAANVVLSVFVGAVIGAILWRLRLGLVFGAACLIVYFLVAPPMAHYRLVPFASLNAPPAIMAFLICYVMARHLKYRRSWKWIWATLVAFACALALGALYLRLFGALWHVSFWAMAWLGLVADAGLLILAVRSRKLVLAR